MATVADFRRLFSSNLSSPDDVARALDALEDVCHEAAGEVEGNWQSWSAGAPWRALAKIAGAARVKAVHTLNKKFGSYL